MIADLIAASSLSTIDSRSDAELNGSRLYSNDGRKVAWTNRDRPRPMRPNRHPDDSAPMPHRGSRADPPVPPAQVRQIRLRQTVPGDPYSTGQCRDECALAGGLGEPPVSYELSQRRGERLHQWPRACKPLFGRPSCQHDEAPAGAQLTRPRRKKAPPIRRSLRPQAQQHFRGR